MPDRPFVQCAISDQYPVWNLFQFKQTILDDLPERSVSAPHSGLKVFGLLFDDPNVQLFSIQQFSFFYIRAISTAEDFEVERMQNCIRSLTWSGWKLQACWCRPFSVLVERSFAKLRKGPMLFIAVFSFRCTH